MCGAKSVTYALNNLQRIAYCFGCLPSITSIYRRTNARHLIPLSVNRRDSIICGFLTHNQNSLITAIKRGYFFVQKTKKLSNPNPLTWVQIRKFLAEKERFELSLQLSRTTPLAGEPLRPLGYFSIRTYSLTHAIITYFFAFVKKNYALFRFFHILS